MPLIGSRADVMLVHFRPTLDGIARRAALARSARAVRPAASGLLLPQRHGSGTLSRERAARGGSRGARRRGGRRGASRGDGCARRDGAREPARAAPALSRRCPPDLPYVCFYPMSKRRDAGQNWYALPLEERSRLMMAHGMTGRGYAGRVVQVITGAIGFDAWEWGVTLFAADPLRVQEDRHRHALRRSERAVRGVRGVLRREGGGGAGVARDG